MPTQMSQGDKLGLDVHVRSMWFALVVAAGSIGYFVTRVRQRLGLREQELSRARSLASQTEKLASLATLAAGAAHELSTPLSTIAVIAKEMERSLEHGNEGPVNDARMIRREVERCRKILVRMAADAGSTGALDARPASVRELLAAAVDGLPGAQHVRLHVQQAVAESLVRAPATATAQAVRDVLKNALQASAAGAHVDVEARLQQGLCWIAVKDSGAGMTNDVLARAGEPFFTTKEPGQGMGLGLFLTRVVVERAGGRVVLESKVGRGTTAVLTLPLVARALNGRVRL